MKPPSDTDAERALLSAVLAAGDADPARIVALTGEVYTRLAAQVRAEDFFDSRHAAVWAAMGRVVAEGGGVEAVTVCAALRELGKAREVDSFFVARLTVVTPSGANAEAFASIVAGHAARRRALAAVEAHKARLLEGVDIGASVAALEADSRDGVMGQRDISASAAMDAAWGVFCEEKARAARYGVPELDGAPGLTGALGGIFGGQLTAIGAVPGAGKTALAITAAAATGEAGGRVFFASLEMPREEAAWRLAAGYCRGVPPSVDRINAGSLDAAEIADLQQASFKVAALPLLIEDRALTVNALCALVRAEHSRSPLSLVVVDYLHLLQRDAEDDRARGDEVIRRQSYALKSLAKAIRVPVVVLVQFNRGGAKAERPTMFDALGGSGIEQAADNMLILVPEEASASAAQGRVRIFVDKRRGGSPCREGVVVGFDRARQRFRGVQAMIDAAMGEDFGDSYGYAGAAE